jgi:hypothetical protein
MLEVWAEKRYLSLSGTVRVLERVLLSHLLIEHLSLLRRWRRRAILTLTMRIVVNIWSGPIRRMIVVGSGSHIWRRSAWRRAVELALTGGRLLRRGIVVLLVHMILLTWIRHFERGKQENKAGLERKDERKEKVDEMTMKPWLLAAGKMTLTKRGEGPELN